ncbi:MAG: hypothetical protein V3T24_01890, partial [Longimicrobiales bacterium]
MRMLRLRLGAWILCAAGLGPSMAGAQIVVISSSVQERAATAGERYSGTIRLLNSGQKPQEVRLYQTDYSFHADGRTFYDTPGGHPRSNAPWTRVSPASVVIPAGELVDVSYEVEVPDDDTLRGTYWSMIMAEPVSPNPTGGVPVGGPGVGLRTVVRYGIQVVTHMRGETSHQLRFDDPKVVREGGGRYLESGLLSEGDAGYRPDEGGGRYLESGLPNEGDAGYRPD